MRHACHRFARNKIRSGYGKRGLEPDLGGGPATTSVVQPFRTLQWTTLIARPGAMWPPELWMYSWISPS
jgi:hypothetical protein